MLKVKERNLDYARSVNGERLVSTGIPGLDYILPGGLPANHLYLIEGDPGTGKTTLALQYLLEGLGSGEKGLYVTLSETKAELNTVADSRGWSLCGIGLFELASLEQRLQAMEEYTVFHPSYSVPSFGSRT
jgi:circadian clock protein KaiC